MNKVFYEKRGKKYYPVAEWAYDLKDSWVEGTHVVVCRPGSCLYTYKIDPEFLPLIAATLAVKDNITYAYMNASKAKPQREPITPEQAEAWRNLEKAFGEELFAIRYDSCNDIVEAGLNAMIKEANKLLTNPSVKNAYEQFMLICKLTKENNNELNC